MDVAPSRAGASTHFSSSDAGRDSTPSAPAPRRPAPPRDGRFQCAQALMLAGLFGLLASGFLAFHGREPFSTWFYHFAWWSYILFIDGWVYRNKGESLLLSFPGRFLFLSVLSVFFWTIFEAYNLRLGNWEYLRLPASLPLRWGGYVLAFATVLPALFETADLIDSAGLGEGVKVKPLGWKKRVEAPALWLGLVLTVLPLLLPRLFFPLVWVGFIFLCDPINERLGGASLLSDWRTGQVKRLFSILLAGLLCGILWEWWNGWSGAQWTYTLPFLNGGKIFEMPVAGYLGFPFFAVEAFVMTSLVVTLWERGGRWLKIWLGAVVLAVPFLVFWMMDKFTVRTFLP